MGKYTDDDIRNKQKITCKIAGDYLGISSMAVSIGMRNNLLPIGFAVHNEEKDRPYSESWSYHIIAERLIAYKFRNAKKNEAQKVKELVNIAEDYKIACEIRNYIDAFSKQKNLTDEMKEWIEWANKKANWFDPMIDEEDELLGKREHTESLEEKNNKLDKYGSYYDWY